MLPLRHLIYFASFVFILFCSFFLIRDFVKLNEEFSSPKGDILKEIWQNHLDQTLDADTTLVLDEIILAIKVSLPEPQCPECQACERCAICAACEVCEPCDKKKCPKQKECPVVECEICENPLSETSFGTEENCSEEKQEITAGDLARQLLVSDWEEAVIPDDAKNATFEDLPVINNFGKFQRDRTNYDTSRRGYTPRRLVCDELSEHLESTQSSHWTTECTGVPKYPENVISYINYGLPKSIIEKIEKTGMNKTSIKKLSTPYVFLGVDLFDFEADDANFIRMVREAEAQNADIVSGAVVDEHGHWSSHCGHVHVSNYTLDIWDGYYKSIKSIMHCDVGNGPIVVRKELLQELGVEKNARLAKWPDRLEVLLKLRDRVRFIHCPDCMFYQNENKLEKNDLMRLSRKFKLTNFNFDSNEENFEFTCNEAGIQCGENLYNEKALAQDWFLLIYNSLFLTNLNR